MVVRMAAVAGQFYEAAPDQCRGHIKQLLAETDLETVVSNLEEDLPETIIAGIVPHAGWVFSGDLAALVFSAVKQRQSVDTFVIFGAIHTVRTNCGLLYDRGQWGTPLGTIDIDEELADAVSDQAGDLIQPDCSSHSREHSIEVQVPFIQYLFENAKILPIMVPPVINAHKMGQAVASVVAQSDKNIVCIASTDLTHYGLSYGFTPMGTGPDALKWAKDSNDQFFIDLAVTLQAEHLVESAQLYGSACGAGAVAAAVAAARQLGSNQGIVLGHTTSAEVTAKKFNRKSQDSVGYAGIVFGK